MAGPDRFHQYAAASVARASAADDPDDRNLHLNMALAWVRLAHQSAEFAGLGEANDNNDDGEDAPATGAITSAGASPAP